ncbi:hypothetical protein JKF63_06582 [Porcisia hertigi]|uniref:Uncharacterized protein n=1 Tax=Porcisia hertigi TaxID=2761500 RepID=A0A836IS04_9TRYP|nr:hypothetical protein JKF63_06582 [Porcisia hertigi]
MRLSLVGEPKTSAGGLPPPPPPRQGNVPPCQQDHRHDGSESHLCVLSRVQSYGYLRDSSPKSRLLDVSGSSGRQTSWASSTTWRDGDGMKDFMLSPLSVRPRSHSTAIPFPRILGTSLNGLAISDARESPSHHPSSAIPIDNLPPGLYKPAEAPSPWFLNCSSVSPSATACRTLSNVGSDTLVTDVGASPRDGPLSHSDTFNSIDEPPPHFISPKSQLTLSAVSGKSTKDLEHLDGGEMCYQEPSSSDEPGKKKARVVTTFVQAPLLMNSKVPLRRRSSEMRAPSNRQKELARSFHDRIQVGVRAPRRPKAVQGPKPAPRDPSRSNNSAPGSRRGRSGSSQRQGVSVRFTNDPSIPAPAAGPSVIVVAVVALAYAKLLKPLHAVRARRRFEEVIAPAAAYRIQCKWRRYLQLRRLKQARALQLLVPWMQLRLHRLRNSKLASVLLLQRVLRGGAVRSLHRCLHEQKMRNRALNLLRRYLLCWKARKVFRGLQTQRSERKIVVHQCVQSYLQLFRAEQLEWSAIVHGGAETLQNRPSVSTLDWVEGVASLTGVVLDASVPHRIRATHPSSAVSTGPRLTTSAKLRESINALALLEHQPSFSSDVKKCQTTSGREDFEPLHALQQPCPLQPVQDLTNRSRKRVQGELDGDASSTGAFTASDGASDSPTPSSPTTPVNELFAAHVQLLCRTEAMERLVLERRLFDQHRESLRRPLLLNKAVLYCTSGVPPLFASLMIGMQSDAAQHHAASFFKMEREARCKIIKLYESMPLTCLHRPALNPAAKSRHNDLVRLLNGVDDPWADAERSEQQFFYRAAAHQRLASGMALSPEPQPSPIPPSPAYSSGRAPRFFLARPSHGVTHNSSDRHSPRLTVPCFPPPEQTLAYGTPSELCVQMNVTPHPPYHASFPGMTSLPSHASFALPSIDNSHDSFAPGSVGVVGRDGAAHRTNRLVDKPHLERGDAQTTTGIPSPHRRPRGPPLSLLRKLNNVHSGTLPSSPQSTSLGNTASLYSKDGAREPWSLLMNTYPNTPHSWLSPIREPSSVQQEKDKAADAAASALRSTNASPTGAASSSSNEYQGDHRQDYCISRNADSRAAPLSCHTRCVHPPLTYPPFGAVGSESKSVVATRGPIPTMQSTNPGGVAAAGVAKGYVVTRCPISIGHSPLRTFLSMRGQQRGGGAAAGAVEAAAGPSQVQQQLLLPPTAPVASAARVPALLAPSPDNTFSLPPSTTLSASPSTLLGTGADGTTRFASSSQQCCPPTPPPRRRHNVTPKATAA